MTSQVNSNNILNSAKAMLCRTLPNDSENFAIELIEPENGSDVFELESLNEKIVLRGNNCVSIASALNYYLKHFCKLHISYCGKNMTLPTHLPLAHKKIRIVNLYKYRAYFNYCSLCYTAAWWDWKRWEQEIDFMALNGINMPLSVVGLEGVWYNTLMRFGYSNDDALNFLVGPAFFAWQWMGNIQSHCGPLPLEWMNEHVALGQKILNRQRDLGMNPIVQGFAGTVPMDFKIRFPESDIADGVEWSGFSTVPGRLNPLDPMFERFGKIFIEEQTRLFGPSRLYAVDPFHEGTPPDESEEYLTKVGEAISLLISDVDSKAKCVMQSWSLRKEIACSFPHDRLIILDLAGHKAETTDDFWGYDYLKGVLHNFGGRINLHGDLKYIAENHFARSAKNVKNCVGMGMFMEGMGQNPVFYDLVFDQIWADEKCNAYTWLKAYSQRRYGLKSLNAEAAWKILLKTVYAPGTNSVEKSSIICARPALHCKKSGPNAGFDIPYEPLLLIDALNLLLVDKELFCNSDAYEFDVVDLTRQVFSNFALIVHRNIEKSFNQKEQDKFDFQIKLFFCILRDVDGLLLTRDEFSFIKWLENARKWGKNQKEKSLYELNASMLLTLWGPEPEPTIFDYAWREWGGLIKHFYMKRWEMFYDFLSDCLNNNIEYADPDNLVYGREAFRANSFYHKLADWEISWCGKSEKQFQLNSNLNSGIYIAENMLKKYGNLLKQYYTSNESIMNEAFLKNNNSVNKFIGHWNADLIEINNNLLSFDVSRLLYGEGYYMVVIQSQNGEIPNIENLYLSQNNIELLTDSNIQIKKNNQRTLHFVFKLKSIAFDSKYLLRIKFEPGVNNDSFGEIFLKYI